ncbi:Clp protease ClpP [Rhodobacter sp. NTK016B]|uniref:head maturation protease, ClpP-related n=1 Tax=Rhodobacter sp. NTK016B TaxID=2759676 RepID=UPI001A8D23C1|nr:head maturation protease, ClpP-related [Rhodobacter sp. NTK016B]MBN8291034.1 Clp protease ClpP [Rhodobacter sp. NTK016B]
MPEIYLEGMVGAPPWPDEPHFTAATVRAELARAGGDDVTVYLNCPGGLATEGLAVFHALSGYSGKVSVVVSGIAASAGSLVAMAGEDIVMLTGAMMMIHDPAVPFIEGRGTEAEHRDMADSLALMSQGYAEVYATRAGITAEAAREIMRAETWFTAEDAVAAGFATRADASVASDAAAFAYATYHHSPRHLLAGPRAASPSPQAVMAWIGGTPPATPQMKESDMDPEDDDDLTTGQGDDTTEGGDAADDTPPAGGDTPEDDDDAQGDDDAAEDDDDTGPAAEASAICAIVEMNGGSLSQAGDFIAQGIGLRGVIAHYQQKGHNVPKPTRGPSTRILRDERETRRAGMTAALAAQFARRDPTDDRARPFMSMSLVEMAANASGYRGSLRTADDRLRVFMDMHSTSDFPLALSNALNKALADRYREAPSIYRQIAREKSFKDFRAHSIIRPGDFPMLQKLGEGGEIKAGTIGESAEAVTLVPYAVRFDVTRQVLINDDTGAIADAIADQGRMVARFEEMTFFAVCFGNSGNGPTLSNNRAVFNTNDGTKANAGAAIGVDTLGTGRAAIRKHKSLGGASLNLSARILLVSPDQETAAEQVVSPLVPADAAKVNPFAGKLTVLSSAELKGNGWYLLTDPADAAQFVFGFLEGASGPRMRMEEPFGRSGMSWSLEHDFAAGSAGRVGGWFNPGQ